MISVKLVKDSIKNDEFISFLKGTDGYQNDERINPSPISYKENLLVMYELMKEDNSFAEYLISMLRSLCHEVEEIFIVANYLYVLMYHVHNGKCDIPINYSELMVFLSEGIIDNKHELEETDNLPRLGVRGNIYEKLVRLNCNCLANTGEPLFYID